MGCGTISSLLLSNISRCVTAAAKGEGLGKASKQILSRLKRLHAANRPGLYLNRYTDDLIPISSGHKGKQSWRMGKVTESCDKCLRPDLKRMRRGRKGEEFYICRVSLINRLALLNSNKCYPRSLIARTSKSYHLRGHAIRILQLLKRNDARGHLLIHPRASQIRKTAVFSLCPEEVMAA